MYFTDLMRVYEPVIRSQVNLSTLFLVNKFESRKKSVGQASTSFKMFAFFSSRVIGLRDAVTQHKLKKYDPVQVSKHLMVFQPRRSLRRRVFLSWAAAGWDVTDEIDARSSGQYNLF